MNDVLERYFAALRAHDWRALAETLAPDVHRTGPYCDEVRGRDAYVAFLADVIAKLPGYALDVARIRSLAGGGAIAEIAETIDRDGARFRTPEALLFEFDAAGRIARVDVYIKQPRR